MQQLIERTWWSPLSFATIDSNSVSGISFTTWWNTRDKDHRLESSRIRNQADLVFTLGSEPDNSEVNYKSLLILAIANLKKSIRGQILLLVGPRGVGKTSLGQSIERAMNRKFTRVALSGVRDKADIRGQPQIILV